MSCSIFCQSYYIFEAVGSLSMFIAPIQLFYGHYQQKQIIKIVFDRKEGPSVSLFALDCLKQRFLMSSLQKESQHDGRSISFSFCESSSRKSFCTVLEHPPNLQRHPGFFPVKTSSGTSMTTVFQGVDTALKPAISSEFQGFSVGQGNVVECLGVKTFFQN